MKSINLQIQEGQWTQAEEDEGIDTRAYYKQIA